MIDEREDGEQQQAPQASLVKRDAFGTVTSPYGSTSSSAMETAEVARVQAKFAIAKRFPRVMATVRAGVLEECKRSSFADIARYRKPKGYQEDENGKRIVDPVTGKFVPKYVEGPSVRLIECFLQRMGNIERGTKTIYEDDRVRIIEYAVFDYEHNSGESRAITIEKTIERRRLQDRQQALSSRLNSYGDVVYVLPATPDDVREKEARMVAFARRDLGKLFIPKDLLDEAERVCVETLRAETKKDPTAARKRLIDNFATIGVTPEQVTAWLGGKPIEQMSEDDILDLRVVGASIKEGDTTWEAVMRVSPYVAPEDGEVTERDASLKATLKQRRDAAEAKRREAEAKGKNQATVPAGPEPQAEPSKKDEAAPKPAGRRRQAEDPPLGPSINPDDDGR